MKFSRPCPCPEGRHELDLNREDHMQVARHIREWGNDIEVTTARGKWSVPRIYIAIHGLKEAELPELGKKYGWEIPWPSR